MGEPPRLDIRYEGCFSGPPVKAWQGGIAGFLLGIILGLIVAGIPASLAASLSLWIGCIIVCTVLSTVFCRMRRFTVDLRADHLEMVTRRIVRSIPYHWIRFVDAGARIDPTDGERPNVRVRILGADGRTTRIGLNSTAASSLVGALRYRCPRAGGIQLDGTDWLPEDPAGRREVRRRLRRTLLEPRDPPARPRYLRNAAAPSAQTSRTATRSTTRRRRSDRPSSASTTTHSPGCLARTSSQRA